MQKVEETDSLIPDTLPHPPNNKTKRILFNVRKIEQVDVTSLLKEDPVTFQDILSALETTKSTSSRDLSKYFIYCIFFSIFFITFV